MSFIQARISPRFGAQLGKLPSNERKKISAVLADIRRMNNSSTHLNLGNPRVYKKIQRWVRDIDFLSNGQAGGNRLIYSMLKKDAIETKEGYPGHVLIEGIGDPHSGSGFNQVNTFEDITWW